MSLATSELYSGGEYFREKLSCAVMPPKPSQISVNPHPAEQEREGKDNQGQERRWHQKEQERREERLGLIEERWKQMSCNSLCYVARMEDMEEGDGVGEGGRRRRRSSLSLSPLSRWV